MTRRNSAVVASASHHSATRGLCRVEGPSAPSTGGIRYGLPEPMATPTPRAPEPSRRRLVEVARRIQGEPWNRPGTDKSWVLRVMWDRQRFEREVRDAQGAGTR
jgi:hypothetical protein